MPCTSRCHPPVSSTVNRRPAHWASYATRSRVTPGTSSTTASRRPMMRLTNVDLPTLGRPITARTGTTSDIRASCREGTGEVAIQHGLGPGDMVTQVIEDLLARVLNHPTIAWPRTNRERDGIP